MKLYNSLEVAHQSVKNDKMTSAYMSEFVSFNVLDADYIKEQLDKKIKEEIQLEEIPFIGPKSAKVLLEHFNNFYEIEDATISQLLEIKGISQKNAENIVDYFSQEKNK